MKKSKIDLLFKVFVILTFIYTYFITSNLYFKSKYDINTNSIKGIVIEVEFKNDKTNLIVKGKEKVLVTIYDTLDIKTGDFVEVVGNLKKPSTNTIFNQFNYRNYLLSKKIYWQMTGSSITKIKDSNGLYKMKNKIVNHINTYKSKDYLYTFILGNTDYIEEDVMKSYRDNGISHLLAISGMHITLLSSLLFKILSKVNKNNKFNFIIISLFLCFYAFVTNFSPSILRAVLMFVLLNIKKIYKLKLQSKDILLFIACLLLIINPYYIYNLGFVFSFIISYFLIVLGSESNSYFKNLFKTSLLASAVSIPILITNFFQINLLSTLFNLFFVPFVSFIVFPISLLTFVFPFLDNLLVFLSSIMEIISKFFSNINLTIIFKSTPFYIFVLYYIIIYFSFKNKKYFLFVLPLFIHANIKYFDFNSYLTTIDVGQGDSLLIELENNSSNILIDTGGVYFSDYNMALNKIIPYLKSRGITKLDYLILTHGDFDHMGEAINLVNNFKVEKVILNCGEFNELEQDLIKVLDNKKIPYYSCINELKIDKNKLSFLNNKDYGNENDNSSVIYTELNNYKFLFMGDAGIEVEADLIDKYNLKDIDVLKVGHHGSKTSSSKNFIDEINPKHSIISVGKNNIYGHPNKGVLNTLENSKIYRTDEDGSIMFKIKNNKLKIETCSP